MSLWRDLNAIVFGHLFSDQRLQPTDVAVYGYLWSRPVGSIRSHAAESNISRETIRRSGKRLLELDWAYEITRGRSTVLVPWMPADVEKEIITKLAFVVDDVHFMGEWLMKCLLDILVRDSDFGDNARPSWLVKGDGSGRLELDRWYRSADVAFEFQGQQHFEITSDYTPTARDLQQRRELDHIKAAICRDQGIHVVHVTWRDLDFQTLQDKVRDLFPVTPIKEDKHLVRYLSRRCRSYRNYMAKAAKNRGNRRQD